MKVFLDTNIIVDFLIDRGDFTTNATKLFKLSMEGYFDILICDLTIANIAYITRKDIPREQFYEVMSKLSKYYSIVPVGDEVIRKTFKARWKDFEDSIQYYSALQAETDCIITRNSKDFEGQAIPIFAPHEFLMGYNI